MKSSMVLLPCCWTLMLWAGAGNEPVVPANPNLRAAALKSYDQNGDGRLNDAEREVMRKAVAQRRLGEARSGRGPGAFPMPPELVKEFDKDKDGRLDEEESRTARETMRRRFEEIQKRFDRNSNGRMDPEEMEAFRADMEAGKIQGVPRFFGPPRTGGRPGGGPPPAEVIKRFDRDGDGRLNESELNAARAAIPREPPPARP